MFESVRNLLKSNEYLVSIYREFKYYQSKKNKNDEDFIRKQFKHRVGRELDLENPVNFNEKLQWLKLFWRDPRASVCADKLSVRKIVKKRIGEEYLNELYSVYSSIEEIDIDKLPESFVLKGAHGSGYNLICKNKHELNWDKAFKEMKGWLNKNYYWLFREWVYQDIEPRIICEKFMSEGDGSKFLTDYKFYCFNGVVKYCQVIRGRGENETIDFYDENWRHMPFTGLRPLPNSKEEHAKPKHYSKMIELATKLSDSFPFVRVDFYYVDEKIIFGELTFFPESGYGSFYPSEWNKKIGDLVILDN